MLGSNGGAQRITDFAAEQGVEVDAAAVHATKSRLFQELLGRVALLPCDLGCARRSSTPRRRGTGSGSSPRRRRPTSTRCWRRWNPRSTSTFDVIVYDDHVDEPKPAPAAYLLALDWLGLEPADAVAIEDNIGGVRAALAAGLRCIAFPNANTAGADFAEATDTAEQLDADRVVALAAA